MLNVGVPKTGKTRARPGVGSGLKKLERKMKAQAQSSLIAGLTNHAQARTNYGLNRVFLC
jgi:hypothetical protein